MRKRHSKEGFRSFIFGLIAIMSLPMMIPFGGAVMFPLLIFGPLAIVFGTTARRKKDPLGLVGLAWGYVALCIGLLMIWALIK